ncbi:unnamed protein product, partial [Owenia fusiformis]
MATMIVRTCLLMLVGTHGNPDIDFKSIKFNINQQLSISHTFNLTSFPNFSRYTDDNQDRLKQNDLDILHNIQAQTLKISNTLGNYIPSVYATKSTRGQEPKSLHGSGRDSYFIHPIREKRHTPEAHDRVSVVGGELETVILECPVDPNKVQDVRWFKDLLTFGVTQLTLNANITASKEPYDESKYRVNGTFSLQVKDVNKGDAGRYWCINGDTNETIHDAYLTIIRYRTCPQTPQQILKGQEFELECGTSFWGPRDESYFPTIKWYKHDDDATSTFSNEISDHANQSIATYTDTADKVATSIATCTISVPSGLVETQICTVELEVTEYADTIWIS